MVSEVTNFTSASLPNPSETFLINWISSTVKSVDQWDEILESS
ncbi:hypothetical protein MC7420_40 [Coleofasciculus chthonoplastes PCC 7420]|uniref:Uncharacterized protein n=1 Tax=Coleofasciculus chthonoplastes PCC 7420 TaxID=118168 RepID=B4W2W3_9CYAN|nr:hypothetical protein MC7420_40 [Coleofasciculus chthonoplastes PCC 7420]